jgi:hypothetical protein
VLAEPGKALQGNGISELAEGPANAEATNTAHPTPTAAGRPTPTSPTDLGHRHIDDGLGRRLPTTGTTPTGLLGGSGGSRHPHPARTGTGTTTPTGANRTSLPAPTAPTALANPASLGLATLAGTTTPTALAATDLADTPTGASKAHVTKAITALIAVFVSIIAVIEAGERSSVLGQDVLGEKLLVKIDIVDPLRGVPEHFVAHRLRLLSLTACGPVRPQSLERLLAPRTAAQKT